MPQIIIPSPPYQNPISKEKIEEMIISSPRRFQLGTSFKPLNPPRAPGEDWNLFFPFEQTFVSAFETVFEFNHIGFRSKEGKPSCYTFLKDVNDKDIFRLGKWLNIISGYVAIRDCLALSFALEFDRIGGSPEKNRTLIGQLRGKAKPYNRIATSEVYKCADRLIYFCLEFLNKVQSYNGVEVIVGMPPSDPEREFNLPVYLADGIAKGLGKEDLSEYMRTVRQRSGLKDVELDKKIDVLEGTIEVDPQAFRGKNILLVDDLYQSGVTMNYVAMLLLEAGADKIYGLACEKTCRNDDNIPKAE